MGEMEGARRAMDGSQAGPRSLLYQAVEIVLKIGSDMIEHFMYFRKTPLEGSHAE